MFVSQTPLARALAEAACARVREEFQIDHVVHRVSEIYDELLEGDR
jgi:hypothetical protein